MTSNASPHFSRRQKWVESQMSHDLKTAAEIGRPELKKAIMKTVTQIANMTRNGTRYQNPCPFNGPRRNFK